MKFILSVLSMASLCISAPNFAMARQSAAEQIETCNAVTWPLIGSRSACIHLSADRELNVEQIKACGERHSTRQFVLCLSYVNDPAKVPGCFQGIFGRFDLTPKNDFFTELTVMKCLDESRVEEANELWNSHLCTSMRTGCPDIEVAPQGFEGLFQHNPTY